MPDDNRFAGLGEGPDDGDGEEGERHETADERESDTATGTDDGPAFPFEATEARSLYVRPATLRGLEDLEFEVERLLRVEHDVRDPAGREVHDAVLRVAAEHPELVARAVLAAREDD